MQYVIGYVRGGRAENTNRLELDLDKAMRAW